MQILKREIESNFTTFSGNWQAELASVTSELDKSRDKFLASYQRLTSLQAWRTRLLNDLISKNSLGFFLEAQNDAILSHVLARSGAFNPALKSLRSTIENICNCLYYMDHPVEYELWQKGKHKLAFKELLMYFNAHPKVVSVQIGLDALQEVPNEYAHLSKAVHASAKSFRMTEGSEKPLLLSHSQARVGGWVTREKAALKFVNLLLLTMFREHVQGTRLPDIRKCVSFAVPEHLHSAISEQMDVTLFKL